MSDSIKVAIKVRPLIKREKDENLPIQWNVQGNYIVSTDSELRKRGDGGFHFDHIFDERTNNKNVFDIVVRPIVDAAVNGINGTVIAYGQTSSGKTYTMMGTINEPGIIPLAVEHMFDAIANTAKREFLLRVSYLEIYNEKVNDLLNKSATDLRLHEDVNGQIIIKCKEEVTNSPEHVLSIMKKGDKNRRIGETNMNERSSRSHTIFRITIESRECDADSDGAVQVSQLNLVDLAGSERARQTGATGERFKEGRHINMSLSSLGLVIMQLSESQDIQKYVNFRDSKLTRLLQASLGGNAMTAIICAITPAVLEESQCTLSFASRAKSVKNKPQINEVMSDATLLKRYAKQIAKLNAELEKMKLENRTAEEMESKLHEKDRANQLLEERIELLQTKIVSGDNTHNMEESFKCKSRRRRTWGGPATFKQNLSMFQPSIDLPTIREMSPEKPCRKSIIQSVDLMDQTFQTAFADFELELIKDERDRENEDCSDEEFFITKRKNPNHVTFLDDVCIYKPTYDSCETTPEKKNISCQTASNFVEESPGTPTNVLRERLLHLKQEFNELREYTTLEKQIYIADHHQCVLSTEKQKNIEKLEEQIKSLIAEKTDQAKHIIDLETQIIKLSSSKAKVRRSIDTFNENNKEGQKEEKSNELTEELEEKQKQISHLQQQVEGVTFENSQLKNLVSEVLKFATSANITNTQVDLFDNSIQPTNEQTLDFSLKDIETEYVLNKLQDKMMGSIKQNEIQKIEKISDLDKQILCLESENAALKEKLSYLEQRIDDQFEFQQNISCEGDAVTNLLKIDLNNEFEEDITAKSKDLRSVLEMGKQLIEFSPVKPRRSLQQLKSNNTLDYEQNTEISFVNKEEGNNNSEQAENIELCLDAQEELKEPENINVDNSNKCVNSPTFKNSSIKEMSYDSLDSFDFTNILSQLHVYLDTVEKYEILKLDELTEMFTSQKQELQYVLSELNRTNIEKDYNHFRNFISESINLKGPLQDLEVFIKSIVAENTDMREHLHKQSSVLTTSFTSNIETEELVTDLDIKTQELHEIKSDVIGLKLDMKKLQRTIFLLTTENVELSAKLTAEKELVREIKANCQKTIDDLCEEISKIKDAKIDLLNENVTLTDQIECLKSQIINLKEDRRCLGCKDKMNSSTVNNGESSDANVEHVDIKDIKQTSSLKEVEATPENVSESNKKSFEQLVLENSSLETELLKLQENVILRTQENTVHLNAEIENYKMVQEQIQNEKYNLETKMVSMKANIEEKENIIKDLQQIINEYRKANESLKEDTYCSENFIVENCNSAVSVNKSKTDIETEYSSEIQKLKDDINTIRKCITKEIQSLQPEQDEEILLNKSVDDLFFMFLQILISKEKEIIDAMQQQFSSDKKRLEDEKQQSMDAENRATLRAKELETEITKLQNNKKRLEDEKKQSMDAENRATLRAKELETEITKLQNNKKRLEDEKQQSMDAENRATLRAKELETEITKLQNNNVKQVEEHCELLNKIASVEELLKESNHEKQLLTEKLQSLEKDYDNLQKCFKQQSEIKVQQEDTSTKNKEIELQAEMKREKEEYEGKISNLVSALETYKVKNLELVENLESLETSEKDLKNILNIRTNELAKSNENVDKIKSEIEHLTNAYNKLNHETENKDTRIAELTAEIEELGKCLESHKIKNMDLTKKLEQLEINEKNLNVALNVKINELATNDQNVKRMKTEMERLMNTCDGLNHDIKNRDKRIAEVTALLQNKSDALSEYKTRLEAALRELEHLKEQLEEQKSITNKYETELETLKVDNEIQLVNVKDALNLESSKYAEANKQLADLNNKHISLLAELDTLKEQCSQLEHKNMKLEHKMRNSVSKIQTETRITDLEEQNKTLQNNLEGAYNCITELKDKKNHLLEEMVNVKKQNESLLAENMKIKDLLSNKTKQENSALLTLEEQYKTLLNEKSKIVLELNENKMLLCQKEQNLKHYTNQIEELKRKNKELDEEVEALIKENEQMTEKIYSFFDDKLEDKLRIEVERLKEENNKLHAELQQFNDVNKSNIKLRSETIDTRKGCCDNNEIFQQQKQSQSVSESNINKDDDEFVNIKKQMRELELELVLKNGRIAALELQIQSETFPYKKKCKDLKENMLAFRNKNIQLENEIKDLRHTLNDLNMKECNTYKNLSINTKNQYVQTIPNNPIKFCGTSSGIIDEYIKIQKLEKEVSLMKQLCRSRARRIKELEAKLMEIENAKSLSDESNLALKENIFFATSRHLSN